MNLRTFVLFDSDLSLKVTIRPDHPRVESRGHQLHNSLVRGGPGHCDQEREGLRLLLELLAYLQMKQSNGYFIHASLS